MRPNRRVHAAAPHGMQHPCEVPIRPRKEFDPRQVHRPVQHQKVFERPGGNARPLERIPPGAELILDHFPGRFRVRAHQLAKRAQLAEKSRDWLLVRSGAAFAACTVASWARFPGHPRLATRPHTFAGPRGGHRLTDRLIALLSKLHYMNGKTQLGVRRPDRCTSLSGGRAGRLVYWCSFDEHGSCLRARPRIGGLMRMELPHPLRDGAADPRLRRD